MKLLHCSSSKLTLIPCIFSFNKLYIFNLIIIDYREQFELCVSRAVANLSTLSEYCLPYVKIGGMFVSYKSGNIDDEMLESKKGLSGIDIFPDSPFLSYRFLCRNSRFTRIFFTCIFHFFYLPKY